MDFLPAICLLITLFQVDAGSVNIEVQVLQFDNPTGTSYNGSYFRGPRKCCDMPGNSSCTIAATQDYCDTYVTICIGRITGGGCASKIFTSQSYPLVDSNSYFTANSPTFRFAREISDWKTNTTQIIVNINDYDDETNSDLIDDLIAAVNVEPAQTYFTARRHIIHMHNHASVDLELRIWCTAGFCGGDCNQRCHTDSYHSSTVNGSTVQDTCSGADAMSIKYNSDINTLVYKQLVLDYLALRLCPANTTVIRIDICTIKLQQRRMDFRAQCDNAFISALALSHSLFIDNIAFRSELRDRFNGFIPALSGVSAISLLDGLPVSVLMMIKIVRYHDPERLCVPNTTTDCWVVFTMCFGRLSDNSCPLSKTTTVNVQQQGSTLTSTGDYLYDPSIPKTNSTQKTTLFIQLSEPPEFHGDIKYGSRPRGIFNDHLRSLSIGDSYLAARPHLLHFSFGKRSLDVEIMAWCSNTKSGIRCQCPVSGLNHKCDGFRKPVCAAGYSGVNCTDVNECETSNPCQHGGTCRNTIGSYTCSCTTGWTGQSCHIDVDECSLGVCTNSLSCNNIPGNFSCSCISGFTGTDCSMDLDECHDMIQCKYNGTCFNTYGDYFCRCPENFSGRHCEVYLPQNHELMCSNNTIKQRNTTLGVSCTCFEGWSGLDCSQDINECVNETICNNGICSNVPGSFSCSCLDGWTGKTCSEDVNECLNKSNCVYGNCVNSDGGYNCSCSRGWSGNSCAEDINECLDNTSTPCLNNGTCFNQPGNFSCFCTTAWSGSRCETDVDECTIDSSCVHGSCINTDGDYICSCQFGWKGSACKYDVNECEMLTHNPCTHNSSCINNLGSYSCSCRNGFTGLHCDNDINECLNDSVCIHGNCVNFIGDYNCSCFIGWEGPNCNDDINECVSSDNKPCANNGTCIYTLGSFSCRCENGWSGSRCDIDVDECTTTENLCKNGGVCYNVAGGYMCHCSQAWTGINCSSDVNECLYSPCQHNGTCSNHPGDYFCNCTEEWEGFNCTEDVDECLLDVCNNNSTCHNMDGGYECICSTGFVGDDCSADVDECLEDTCVHGICRNTFGSFQCHCSNGWTGRHCSIDIDECKNGSIACLNKGKCSNTPGDYSCNCPVDWTGKQCQTFIDMCEPNPCLNGATCMSKPGGFYNCHCTDQWMGVNCSVDVDECQSTFCENNGTCINFPGGYNCNCSLGFSGDVCQINTDVCTNVVCHNGGKCDSQGNTYVCSCTNKYTGSLCETFLNACDITECFNNGTCIEKDDTAVCKCGTDYTGVHCQDVNAFNVTQTMKPTPKIAAETNFTSDKTKQYSSDTSASPSLTTNDGNYSSAIASYSTTNNGLQFTTLSSRSMKAMTQRTYTTSKKDSGTQYFKHSRRYILSESTLSPYKSSQTHYTQRRSRPTGVNYTYSPFFTSTNVSTVVQSITTGNSEYFTVFFQCTTHLSNVSVITEEIKQVLKLTTCRRRKDINVQKVIRQIEPKNSLELQGSCDNHVLSSQELEHAFHSISEDKLRTLFPCEHEAHGTDYAQKSWFQENVSLIVGSIVGVIVLTVITIAVFTMYRRRKYPKLEEIDLQESSKSRSLDNPLYATFTHHTDTDA